MKSSTLRNMFTSDLCESFRRVPRSTNNRILPVTAFISWGELGGKWFSCAVQVHFHALEKNCVCKRMKRKPDSLCSVSAKCMWGEELLHPRVNSPADHILGTGQHRALTLIFSWPKWSPWPVWQEFPGTFSLQLVLPLPYPQLLLHTPCWAARSIPRNTNKVCFYWKFRSWQGIATQETTKIFCHLTSSALKCYLPDMLIMSPLFVSLCYGWYWTTKKQTLKEKKTQTEKSA